MPGKIVGVTRVLNEDAIIEPFVRHHAPLLDQHLFLDNGSTDRTLEILHALHGEGLPLQVYQTESPVFAEPVYNTGLYALAEAEGAAWVAFLDCDEFIDARRLPDGFRPFLAGVDPGHRCVRLPAVDYLAARPETADELNPVRRLVMRMESANMFKVLVRAGPGAAPGAVSISAGSHAVLVDGAAEAGLTQAELVLAHFPRRSPLQVATKLLLGRMKVLARGTAETNPDWSCHYTAPFEAMKRQPRAWLAEAAQVPDLPLEHDPLEYLGGSLVYTHWPDEEARLLAAVASYGESLARSHGGILDRKRLVRAAVLAEASQARRLF